MKHKDITVLLLLYKTPKYTLDNLRNYKKFNIMILDQSNDIDLRKKIVKILPNIKYYKITSKNKGFAWGINFLSKKVKTKFFLCSQPDVKIFYNDILRLKKSFQKNKDAIISIPHIYSLNNFNLKQAKKKKIVNVERFIGAIFLSEKKNFLK